MKESPLCLFHKQDGGDDSGSAELQIVSEDSAFKVEQVTD